LAMKKIAPVGLALLACSAAFWTACSRPAPEQVAGSGPATPEDELTAIDAVLSANPDDAVALERVKAYNAKADVKMGLLHTVDMGGGRLVKFYMPSPGLKLVGEYGPAESERILAPGTTTESFSDVHRYLRPDQAVPQKLVDADATRLDPMLTQVEEIPSQTPGKGERASHTEDKPFTGLVEKHGTNVCAHFQDDHFCRSGDDDTCQCNRTGGGTSSWTGTTNSFHMAASYRGTISFELNFNGSVVSGFPIAVAQGGFTSFFMTSPKECGCPGGWWACGVPPDFCKATHGQRVFNATDDGYHRHMCVDFDNSFMCR
jgi:hypothetical protein